MGDLILGPPGVLPPGEWAVGARVRLRGQTFVLVRRMDSGALYLSAGPTDTGACTPMSAKVVRLDLTTGPLDFGARALLSLVAPEVEQPLTAPGWRMEHAHLGWLEWWTPTGMAGWFCQSGRDDGYAGPRGVNIATDPMGDPRRALATALEASR